MNRKTNKASLSSNRFAALSNPPPVIQNAQQTSTRALNNNSNQGPHSPQATQPAASSPRSQYVPGSQGFRGNSNFRNSSSFNHRNTNSANRSRGGFQGSQHGSSQANNQTNNTPRFNPAPNRLTQVRRSLAAQHSQTPWRSGGSPLSSFSNLQISGTNGSLAASGSP